MPLALGVSHFSARGIVARAVFLWIAHGSHRRVRYCGPSAPKTSVGHRGPYDGHSNPNRSRRETGGYSISGGVHWGGLRGHTHSRACPRGHRSNSRPGLAGVWSAVVWALPRARASGSDASGTIPGGPAYQGRGRAGPAAGTFVWRQALADVRFPARRTRGGQGGASAIARGKARSSGDRRERMIGRVIH